MTAVQQPGAPGPSSGRSPRRPPEAELAAFCLLKLGRPQEALARLEGHRGQQGYGAYLRGLALADLGRLDEAVGCLRQPGLPAALSQAGRRDLLTLLRLQVQARLAAQDFIGASEALGQALEVDPQDQDLLRLQAQLGQRMPVVFLHSGRRPQAQETWEAAQRRNPEDPEPTHSLALCYYWQARQLEEAGDPAASQAWRGAIRNWVALVHHQGFWQGLMRDRTAIYGDIPEAELTALRERLRDDLGRELAAFQSRYQDQKQTQQASRLTDLALELSAEIRSAEALQHVLRSLGRQGAEFRLPPPGGFMMIEHLGLNQDLQVLLNLVQTTQTNLESTEDLTWCLTGFLLPWTLYREGRHLEALQTLERTPSGAQPEPARRLKVMAQVGLAERLGREHEVDQALELLERTAKLIPGPGAERDMLRAAVEKVGIPEATRLRNQDKLDEAIRLLERCLNISDSQRVKEHLSEALNIQAVKLANDKKDYQGALKLLDRALALFPGNRKAAENRDIVKGNMRAQEEEKHGRQAPSGNTPEDRRQLAYAAIIKAAQAADRGDRDEVIKCLALAKALAPDDPVVKGLFRKLGLD